MGTSFDELFSFLSSFLSRILLFCGRIQCVVNTEYSDSSIECGANLIEQLCTVEPQLSGLDYLDFCLVPIIS